MHLERSGTPADERGVGAHLTAFDEKPAEANRTARVCSA